MADTLTLGEWFAQEEKAKAAAKESEADLRRARIKSDVSWLIAEARGDLARDDVNELTADVLAQFDAYSVGSAPPVPKKASEQDSATEGSGT